MINPHERQKFFEQVTALDSGNVNCFDVEEEFFLVDADNLSQVRPHMYGYAILPDGIYDDTDLTAEVAARMDGRGCYVHVDVRGGQITIRQDLNGCFGIFLFRHGNYFALSNSFFRLLDHVKFRYPLTVNRDYCNFILSDDLCNMAYSETAVNEIELLDRAALVHIDIAEKNLQVERLDYREHSISVDSAAGMATLDSWVALWDGVFRGLARRTKFIQADLTGGFDSRISFALMLHSGIDLTTVRVNSIDDDLYTHAQDFAVATMMANHFGFTLNRPLPEQDAMNYSVTDVFNFSLYGCQLFSNIPRLWPQKGVEKIYSLCGYAGETLRYRWLMTPKDFVEYMTGGRKNSHYRVISHDAVRSAETIIKSALLAVADKYKIADDNSFEIPQYLHYDANSRHHFGRLTINNYFKNTLLLSPAIDPVVRTLKLNTTECPDANLLMALIFARYAPDLLTFPFIGQKSIAPETIAFAQKLSERFPQRSATVTADSEFHLQPRDARVEKILAAGHDNKKIPDDILYRCLRAALESSRTYGLFTAYFDSDFYNRALVYYKNVAYERDRPAYAVTGVTRVLEDVEISNRHRPRYRDVMRFIEDDHCEIHDDIHRFRKFAAYFTAMIQIKFLQGSAAGDLQLVAVSDGRADVLPFVTAKGGVGYIIGSYAGELNIVAKAVADGQVQILLFSPDVRRDDLWIDYTNLTVNGQTVFDTTQPACRKRPYGLNFDVRGGDDINISTQWSPHNS